MPILHQIQERFRSGEKSLAILIDPEKKKTQRLPLIVDMANTYGVDYFFVGGSILLDQNMDETIKYLKNNSSIPVILFPGGEMQLHEEADAILFLSLISGRNPEYLISKQVSVAPTLSRMGMEVLSTGYILFHGSSPSTASYISNTQAIPHYKPELAAATALAGQMLGLKLIYLEGGSGTARPIPSDSIKVVRQAIGSPILVGGGIRTTEKLRENYLAGADIQILGTAVEQSPDIIRDMCTIKIEMSQQLSQI